MSLYLGSKLLSGFATDTISNAHSLLDFKWTDHILNEMSWLRADTFSWHNGLLYKGAYNHLVEDVNGKSADNSDTIGSYTIWYVLADDGHKIVGHDQETIANNIYNESGVSWYYILDKTNKRFKLPRENPNKEKIINLTQAPVVGNGMTLGLQAKLNSGDTSLTNFGLSDGGSDLIARTTAYGTSVGTSHGAGDNPVNQYGIGVTTDPTKSGLVAKLDSSTSSSYYKGKQYLYF